MRITLPSFIYKPALLLFVTILSCNNKETQSAFGTILSEPPYAVITDSIENEPRRDDLYFRRAVLLNKNNLPEPALADFRKAWSLSKQETYAVGISNILLEKNKEEAITFLREALKELPESIFMQLGLARLYMEQNKTSEALVICNTILQQQPDQVNALLLKADLLQLQNDAKGAAAALENAYALVPGNLEIAYKLAYQYAENKNQKVLAFTDSLIVHDAAKIHPEPFYVKGLYYSNTNEKQKAIQFFDQTIKMDYNNLNAYIEKGKAQLDLKKSKDALQTFQLANTISPSFPDAYYWIGKCLEISGDKEEAKLNYQKAYGLDKTFAEAKEAAAAIN